MIHDEVIVDGVGLLAGDFSPLLQVQHHGRPVTETQHIAHQPHVCRLAGKAEEAHERRKEPGQRAQQGVELNHALQHHKHIDNEEDNDGHLELRHGPGLQNLGQGTLGCRSDVHIGLRHLGQKQIQNKGGNKGHADANEAHAPEVGTGLVVDGALHGQGVAEQNHDADDGCLAQSQVNGHHGCHSGIRSGRSAADEEDSRLARQSQQREQGI